MSTPVSPFEVTPAARRLLQSFPAALVGARLVIGGHLKRTRRRSAWCRCRRCAVPRGARWRVTHPADYLGAKHMTALSDHVLFLAGEILLLHRLKAVALYASLFAASTLRPVGDLRDDLNGSACSAERRALGKS